MEKTAYVSGNPFKVIKMMNGEDVLCKVLEEYKDALVVEYPMAVVKNQIVEQENHIVEHTGLQRWMNFTHDKSFLILKEKILTLGDLAPEVTLYYKHISQIIVFIYFSQKALDKCSASVYTYRCCSFEINEA